jgi:formylglycine-generating enzyme required for sulfatase activity
MTLTCREVYIVMTVHLFITACNGSDDSNSVRPHDSDSAIGSEGTTTNAGDDPRPDDADENPTDSRPFADIAEGTGTTVVDATSDDTTVASATDGSFADRARCEEDCALERRLCANPAITGSGRCGDCLDGFVESESTCGLAAGSACAGDDSCAGNAECRLDSQGNEFCTPVAFAGMPFEMEFVGVVQGAGEPWRLGTPLRMADGPEHDVVLSRRFLLGIHEVTRAQWLALGFAENSFHASPDAATCTTDNCPVERISWIEAITWLNSLSTVDGLEPCYRLENCINESDIGTGCPASSPRGCTGAYTCSVVTFAGLDCDGYRLPTEAEWEYAAAAGTNQDYWWGNWLGEIEPTATAAMGRAWFNLTSGDRTHSVGELSPSPFGHYDMSGNVKEWTHNRGTPDYSGFTLSPDPVGPDTGTSRIIRGGSFLTDIGGARANIRTGVAINARTLDTGFRVARTLVEATP